MNGSSGTVAVFGATGFTGRLVLDALRARGMAARAVGRSPNKLRDAAEAWRRDASAPPIETAQADATDPAAVRRALDGTAAVISTAGPFTRFGRPCVDAAVELGIDYLDSTGEQTFVMDCHQRLDAAARRAGIAVINAMAYEVAPSDLGAAIAADGLDPVRDVVVAYDVDMGGAATSRGTRLSILEMVAHGGWRWSGGKFRRELIGDDRGWITFAAPRGRRLCASIPGAENLTIPRHVDAERCTTFMAFPPRLVRTLAVGRRALPWMMGTRLGDVARRRAARGSDGPEGAARGQGFTILVEAYGERRFRRVTLRGTDPYGLTGACLAEAARRILAGEETTDAAGVLAPAQKLRPVPFLAALAPLGLSWELEEGTL